MFFFSTALLKSRTAAKIGSPPELLDSRARISKGVAREDSSEVRCRARSKRATKNSYGTLPAIAFTFRSSESPIP